MAALLWLKEHAEGVLCAVQVLPKSASNTIEGTWGDTDGQVYLKVKITTAPEGGKANAALLKFLAKAWHIPVSRFSLLYGENSRRKRILIIGDTAQLMQTITAKFVTIK